MKFLIDAQLPRYVVGWLGNAGCDAIHTLDLLKKNRTTDTGLIKSAERDGRVVVTKDADFVNSHLLNAQPSKLLLISVGNISNRELERLLVPLIPDFVCEFQNCSFIELNRDGMIIREK